MITEIIFSWPGIGRWLIDSIYQRDYPAIQGGLMAISLFIIFATIIAELIYFFILRPNLTEPSSWQSLTYFLKSRINRP